MAMKRKASAIVPFEDDGLVDHADEFVFYGLGGCQEVGRSCHVVQYMGKTVLVRLAPS